MNSENKFCCVIGKEQRKEKIISDALVVARDEPCPYIEDHLYEHKEEHFCILHLPFEEKTHKKLHENAINLFNKKISCGFSCFKFIALDKVIISNVQLKKSLYFLGCNLREVTLKNLDITETDSVCISHCILKGKIIVKDCKFNDFSIMDSEVFHCVKFNTVDVKNITKFSNNRFISIGNQVRYDYDSFGICIHDDCNIKKFNCVGNVFKRVLSIFSCSIQKLSFLRNTFFVCPKFSKTSFELPKEIKFLDNIFKDDYIKGKQIIVSEYGKLRDIKNLLCEIGLISEGVEIFNFMKKIDANKASIEEGEAQKGSTVNIFNNHGDNKGLQCANYSRNSSDKTPNENFLNKWVIPIFKTVVAGIIIFFVSHYVLMHL